MYFNVYNVFETINYHQHVSAAIAATYRAIIQEYKGTSNHICIFVFL
jgi:hypothetical protein